MIVECSRIIYTIPWRIPIGFMCVCVTSLFRQTKAKNCIRNEILLPWWWLLLLVVTIKFIDINAYINNYLTHIHTHTGICFSFNVDNFSKTRLLFVVVATFCQAVSDLQFVSSVLLRKTKTAITVKLHVASLVSILAQCTSAWITTKRSNLIVHLKLQKNLFINFCFSWKTNYLFTRVNKM